MDRCVLITGGANGIGYNMAQTLLQQGDRVAVLDVATDHMPELQTAYPERFRFCQCDLTDDEAVRTAVDSVVAGWSRIDVLVNNACRATFGRFDDRTLGGIRDEFEVNYFGALRVIKSVLPLMKARHSGVIHNVSSGVGITGFPGMIGYTSTKGAIEAMTKTLALELASDGITVNIIHPTLTRTKSAEPLGVPGEMMASAEYVGRCLARQIGRTNRVITPDRKTALFTRLMYNFPYGFGRLLASATEKARQAKPTV
jgi:NAD(P)-dependent dehydrogenase (short-subunit alcohol dehydrogenase family)